MRDLVPSSVSYPSDESTSIDHWTLKGGIVPLFDLLTNQTNNQGSSPASERIFSKQDYQNSIIREVQLLLNARVKLPIALYNEILETPNTKGFPELYGIPDFSAFDCGNKASWSLYADYIKNAIMAYETRLTNVDVNFDEFEPQTQIILAFITGDIIYQSMVEPFSFSVKISKSS